MNVQAQISDYLAAQPERKRGDMQTLHSMMLRLILDCQLWFLDGKDERGRAVSNPNIGYERLIIPYADGSAPGRVGPPGLPEYLFFATIETVCTVYIVWKAWTWSPVEADA